MVLTLIHLRTRFLGLRFELRGSFFAACRPIRALRCWPSGRGRKVLDGANFGQIPIRPVAGDRPQGLRRSSLLVRRVPWGVWSCAVPYRRNNFRAIFLDVANITQRLKALYALAILRPEEENNEGRKNEARNSAFLLLKIARENGVQLQFKVKVDGPSPIASGGPPPEGPKRYQRPTPPAPTPKKRGPKPWEDDQGWTTCSCGKPIATRVWYDPFRGCTHAEHA